MLMKTLFLFLMSLAVVLACTLETTTPEIFDPGNPDVVLKVETASIP